MHNVWKEIKLEGKMKEKAKCGDKPVDLKSVIYKRIRDTDSSDVFVGTKMS